MSFSLRTLAALLGYPSKNLVEAVPELRAALAEENALSANSRTALEPLLIGLSTRNLFDLQADYSELFDSTRRLSLHLFEHVHGDNKDRGQAMSDLGLEYIKNGLEMTSNELPDYIPMFLEFTGQLTPEAARDWLREPIEVFTVLAERLADRETPYAAVFAAVVELADGRPDAGRVEEIGKAFAEDENKSVDELWEEAPVSFGTAAFDNGGPTGVIARIRASNRARKSQEGARHE
ncbi:nitrate reductase molybdenum cofactor assembly chaperone [Croceicoccus sp. F390]|uniref:Nitrate reductase molybdenum cofactor assembly chaperone n=1 Tax=Croceicoccus esteveae TaxID=3075597 RepID=A0ABU2ZIC2_9SPHN|nr:nitrate reductase molybdenum cofactor assembly chaperone [Croceicoccus sp. F390]MDT0576049.1 nitrate reductase molybdenum cofactor assembly chaperone [Croceicoccus sp. F390]